VTEPLLRLESVDAAYRRRPILEQVALALPPGRITALLGPNGAGKSTVLKAIFGLAPITAGRVLFDGQPITGSAPVDNLRRGIVYLPQGGQVFGPLTVAENLTVAAAAMGSSRPAHDAIEAAVARLAAAGLPAGKRAAELSGGQKQQVAVAMALLWQPRVLLIDEPSIGLAPALAQGVMDRLLSVRDEFGTAVLLVEQNVPLAMSTADYLVLLVNGRVVDQAAAAAVRDDPARRRQFTFGLTPEAVQMVD